MRGRSFVVALLLANLGVVPASWAGAEQGWNYMAASKIKWLTYGKKSFQQAKALKRPLFVLVYNDSCGWCRKFETETIETDPIRRRLSSDYLPVAVDAAKQPEMAKQLGAAVVPTTLLLTPDGRKIVKFHGFVAGRDLADVLDANLYRWRKGEIPAEEFGSEATCCPLEAPPGAR